MKVAISIDPGFGGCGFATWSVSSWRQLVSPMSTGIVRPKGNEDLAERGRILHSGMIALYKRERPTAVFLEWPRFFGFSGKGQRAAGRGDLGKLFLAASTCAAAAWGMGIEVVFIGVAWKGQLSKNQMIYRIRKLLKCAEDAYKSHEWDAIGIGLTIKGFLK